MNQDKPTGAFGGFVGAIKGALFTDEPKNSANGGQAKQAAPAVSAVQPGARSLGVASVVPTSLSPEQNPLLANMMQVVMGKATAYTALEEALAPLEKYIPDEASRFKAAFDIVGKTRTIEQIVQAIEMQHIQALQDEAQKFNGQAQGKQDQEITARLAEADGLRSRITGDQEEVIRLRKQTEDRLKVLDEGIASSNQKIKQIEQEVADKRASIERVNAQFNAAVSAVKDHLAQAKAKVIKYLAS